MKALQYSEVDFPGETPSQPVAIGPADPDLQAEAIIHLDGYRALVERTIDVFGDEIKAARWLSAPSVDFKGRPPIQVAMEVDYDPRRVAALFEPVFTVIEHGIYT